MFKAVFSECIYPLVDSAHSGIVLPSHCNRDIVYVIDDSDYLKFINRYGVVDSSLISHGVYKLVSKETSLLSLALQREVAALQVYDCILANKSGQYPSLYVYHADDVKKPNRTKVHELFGKLTLDVKVNAMRQISKMICCDSSVLINGNDYWKYEYGLLAMACTMFDKPALFNLNMKGDV